MSSRYSVCKMRLVDIPTVIDIADVTDLSHLKPGDLVKAIENVDSICLVILETANRDRTPAGFLFGKIVDDSSPGGGAAEIYDIAVVPKFQKRGLGLKLLQKALGICLSRKVSEVWLEARASNLAALAFYQCRGFKVKSIRKDYYIKPIEDALIMRLELQDKERTCQLD